MSQKHAEDDFDDVLDEFAAGPPAQAQSQPAASASRDTSAADAPPDLDDQDFLAEFTKNMRALLSEDQLTPEAASAAPQSHAPASASGAAASAQTHQQAAGQDDVPPLSKKEEEDIRRYFSEALAKDFGDPGPQGDQQGAQRPPGISEADLRDAIGMIDEKWAGGNAAQAQPQASTATSGPQPSTSASSGDSFQDTLRATAERMRSSNTQPGGGMPDLGSEPDLARLLASLSGSAAAAAAGGGGGGGGVGGDEDFPTDEKGLQDAIEMMMGQLMSKDLLYDPMVELKTSFPKYLEEHKSTLTTADKERYQKQQSIAEQIVAIFDRPGFSDEDPKQREEVVSLMSQMQECGSPPKELMGEMPPGLNFGEDGSLPEGCPTS